MTCQIKQQELQNLPKKAAWLQRILQFWNASPHNGLLKVLMRVLLCMTGVIGLWPSRAVTFLDNHDTGSTLNHWPYPWKNLPEGYAYLLTHSGEWTRCPC
jgi:hypothetical protein